VLVDLGDAVAEELQMEFDRISLEMLVRGLCHFSVVYQKELAAMTQSRTLRRRGIRI
jgi:hypothetical protein